MIEKTAATNLSRTSSSHEVRNEMFRVLKSGNDPAKFFAHLRRDDILSETFPELHRLTKVPAGPEHAHGEGDAFTHTLMVMTEMHKQMGNNSRALLAAIAHDLGKGLTDRSELPSHPKHTVTGPDVVENLCERLGLVNEFETVMKDAARYHMYMHKIEELRAKTLLDMVESLQFDCGNNNHHITIDEFISLGVADSLGRIPATTPNETLARGTIHCARVALNEFTRPQIANEYDDDVESERVKQIQTQRQVEYVKGNRP